jgi:hypothetical protein
LIIRGKYVLSQLSDEDSEFQGQEIFQMSLAWATEAP